MPFWIACLIVAKTTLCIQFSIPTCWNHYNAYWATYQPSKMQKNLSMHSQFASTYLVSINETQVTNWKNIFFLQAFLALKTQSITNFGPIMLYILFFCILTIKINAKITYFLSKSKLLTFPSHCMFMEPISSLGNKSLYPCVHFLCKYCIEHGAFGHIPL